MSKKYVVPSIFTAVDKFSGPVNKMSKNAESSMARMERKFRKVGDRAFSVSRQSAMMGAAIIGPMGLMANSAVKFEEKMSNVSTLIDTTQEDMSKMGEEVLKLSKRLPVPIDELTTSLYDIRSAGISAGDAMSTLETSGRLATAGLSTVTEATNIQTSAMNAFKTEGLTAAQTADILFKTVKAGKTTISELSTGFGATASIIQSANVRLADFQAATAALTTTGTPATQAQTQLRASIVALQKPTQEMQKVFKALGVTTDKELIAKYGDLGSSFDAINNKVTELGLNTAKTWSSTEALAAVTSITGATNETYVKTLDDMVNGSDALNEAYDKQAKTGKNSMQIAKNNMQALSITLGTTLIPIINDLVSAVTPVIEKFSTWVSENRGTVKTIMKVAAVVGGLALAVSAVSLVVGVATKAFAIYKYGVIGFNAVVKAARIAQIAWNAAMAANPIGLFIGVAVAAAAAVYALSDAFSSQSREQRLNNEVQKRALDNTIDQRVEVGLLFNKLRKLNPESSTYQKTLAKIEQIQPGITKQYNLQAGAIDDINRAEKSLISTIMKRAETEARAELIRENMKKAMQAQTREMTTGETAMNLISGVLFSNPNQEAARRNNEQSEAMKNVRTLSEQQAQSELNPDETRVSNPVKAQSISTSSMVKESTKEQIELTMGEDLKGLLMLNRKGGNGGGGLAMPGVPNTN